MNWTALEVKELESQLATEREARKEWEFKAKWLAPPGVCEEEPYRRDDPSDPCGGFGAGCRDCRLQAAHEAWEKEVAE